MRLPFEISIVTLEQYTCVVIHFPLLKRTMSNVYYVIKSDVTWQFSIYIYIYIYIYILRIYLVFIHIYYIYIIYIYICYGKCEKSGNIHIFRLLCSIQKIGLFIRYFE